MSHTAFRPRGEDLALEAEYVVVGSGAGGATAGVTLARGGAKVAVIEAGPWREPKDYPASIYGAMRDMVDAFGSTITRGRALWPIVQGSLVGGTTVINSAIGVRTPADIFAQWQRDHGIGGAAMTDAIYRIQDDLERELSWSEAPPAARGRSNLLARQAGDALGFENHYMRRYVKDCGGHGECFQGCRDDRKQSLNRNFIPETIRLGGDVVSCAPVERILFEGRRAVGVEGRFRHPQTREKGARFTVRATKGVLVAASATKSPLLLMRSGVKGAAVGKYFRAHPGAPIFGVYDDPIDMNTGATQGWASTAFRERPGFKLETLSLPIDMIAGRLAGSGRELMDRLSEFRHLAMWVHACRAETVGTVKAGLNGRPAVHYSLDEADMKRFRDAMVIIAKMHVAAGARAVLPCVFGMPYRLAPNEIHKLEDAPLDPRAYVAILSHLFGGCVMGKDPARSVCDERGRVHGYEGLTIADASAIPTNLGVNPQHTIMALARLFAEQLLAEERPQSGRTAKPPVAPLRSEEAHHQAG
ncbi:MAG TPA: GMC family oxidoreductase [Polyangiaceae bacterium]|jgi:choline dehydrogenase-like flavoprotein